MGRFGDRSARPATLIAAQTTIEGDLQSDSSVYIDGTIRGDVRCASDVSIGPFGSVQGNIRARNLLIHGRVDGQIVCAQVEIEATGQVYGEVLSRALVIAAGGRLVGQSRSLDAKAALTVDAESSVIPLSPATPAVDAKGVDQGVDSGAKVGARDARSAMRGAAQHQ